MAFSLSGSVITQSGTDTNLQGLAGIAGVTVVTTGTTTVRYRDYYLPSLRLEITGTLTHNPETEALHFGDASPFPHIRVAVGGVYNYGRSQTVAIGSTYYSQACGLYSSVDGSYDPSMAGMELRGTLNWAGGSSRLRGSFYPVTGCVINITKGEWNAGGWFRTSDYGQSTITMTVNGLRLNESCMTFGASQNANFNVAGLELFNSPLFVGEGNSGVVKLRDVNYNNTDGAKTIFEGWRDWRKAVAINLGRGSVVPVTVGGGSSPGSILEYVKEVQPTVADATGTAISGAIFYLRDVDNGGRVNATHASFLADYRAVDYLADRVYVAATDGTGKPALQSVLIGSSVYNGTGIATGEAIPIARRGIANTDNYRLVYWSYGHLTFNQTLSLAGTGVLTPAVALLTDTNVTLSSAAAAALTSIATLDNLYDAAKNWKCQATQVNIEFPTATTQPVTASGDVLSIGSLNLVIDSAASTAFAVNTGANTITIKSSALAVGSKFTSLTTTGTVTFVNGGAISAPYTDSTGSSAQLQLTCLAGSTVAVYDGSLTQQDYGVSSSGNYTLNIAPGATGTWTWVADKAGYSPARGTFTPGSGGVFAVNASQPQKLNPDGTAMYQGTSSSICAVTFSGTTTAYIDIGNGTVPLQAAFDEAEDSLTTTGGMRWLASGKSDVSQFNSGSGDFLFLTSGWRLRRAAAGDSNATVQAFVQSSDGTPVDESNGPVRHLSSDSPAAIATAVRIELQNELSRLDVAVSSRLATVGYTAPANSDVAAIKAKTDTLVNGPTLAQIEASSVLAKEATVASKASQTSVNALGTPMQASSYVAPDNTNIGAIKAKVDTLQNTDLTGVATTANVTASQVAIVAEVNANEVKIDAIKAKTDTLVNTDVSGVPAAVRAQLPEIGLIPALV